MENKIVNYWVTMTDKHMSYWGMSKDKKNKLVFLCETYEEAEIVAENAKNQGSQIHINIRTTKPYYNSNYNYVQIKTKDDYDSWYVKGYFKRND